MRIGFFTDTYTPQINGVVTSIQLFKQALEARGHEVYVFAPTPDQHDDGEDTVRFRSVPFVFQPEMRLAAPLSLEAARFIDEVDLDVVHSHDPFAIGLFGLAVARRHKIPYLHTYHTLYPEYVHYVWETRLTQKLAERLSRDFCQLCDAIVAPSTKIDAYLRHWGVTTDIRVLATGIDVARWQTRDRNAVDALRSRLGLTDDDRCALFMGRLGREKNVDLLIRAMWYSHAPDLKLIVGGDGPQRDDLRELVSELGLCERVVFAGYLEGPEVVAAYQLADFFAFGSTSETQGLVIGEAMAAGLPVVCVEDPAVEDFVKNEVSGIVVQARPESLAAAFDRITEDRSLLASMSEAAQRHAVDFSIDRQAERLEQLYRDAIAAYEPRPGLSGRVEGLFRLVQSVVGKFPITRR